VRYNFLMDLYIVRHAWAAERDSQQWPDDDLRPLTKEGKKRFAEVVATLVKRDVKPAVIATSPLVRCQETARILADAVGEVEIVPLDELRPGSRLSGLLAWTNHHARVAEKIAWVGHAPDVDRLAAALIGDGSALMRFAKGAVALIRFDGPISAGDGELQWLMTAKMLGL
jgi:phosphohistidine phosphatase